MHRLATRIFSSIRTTTTITTPITTTTTRTMATTASTAYLDALKARRTIYALNKDLGAVPAARVQAIASEALQHVPSSFNSQSNRVVVLLGAEHDKFWDITSSILKAIVPEASWEATGGKMAMFKAAAGSVCFPPPSSPLCRSWLADGSVDSLLRGPDRRRGDAGQLCGLC